MNINKSRRRFILASTALASSSFLPRYSWSRTGAEDNSLPIPELLRGEKVDGVLHYKLNVQYGQMNFFPDTETSTLGYNGNYLGPTLRMKKGDNVRIEVKNDLNETTTVHWHGVILPASMDGGPHQEIKPGGTWRSEYEIRQRATTLFYHSHTHGQTGQQVYRGLAGMMILDDDESSALGLPSEYGVDDIPVVIQDRDINDDGSLQYIGFMPERMVGKHGKTLLVNGAVSPVLKAQKSLLRLRLLNGSNARFYNLQFSDGREFRVIATDGGLLEQPVTVNRIVMAPAERVEILLDVSDKKSVMLQSTGGVGNAGHGPMRMMGMDRPFDVLLIDAGSAMQGKTNIPKQLTSFPDWSSQPISAERSMDLQMGMGNMMGGRSGGMMRINDQAFDMDRIDFAAKKDSFEIWTISNSSPMIHPFHVHNTQFRILTKNGTKPLMIENGFKDTVVVNTNETVRILVPTGPYADTENPYMFHCHILEHEDGGMMGQFVVES